MDHKTLTKLEFDKITALLVEEASSFRGQQLCRRLKPMTDIDKINTFQEQTAAAFTRIVQKGRISFGDAAPIEESMKRLEVGGALSITELLRISRLLANTARVKAYGRHETQDDASDCLDEYFSCLEPLTPLTNEIERCILSEDEISDDASSTLKHIRRSIGSINDKVHSTLSSLVNGSLRTYLQDPIITMRGDRYCIPVKAEYRGQVQGLIHDQSSTGSTLFIEPMAVVKLNNDLKELYAKEQEEIQAILARLSEEAAQYIEEIRADYRALTDLDFIFARGALALSMNASRPLFNNERRIRIRQGRHPLLDPKKVVPVDIRLGEEFDLLVISGPNTGGKTVSLKTVGLFTLMGQAGLHIPAREHSRLALFHEVFADIGDEQSIEQSLSTFSSHMTNIIDILAVADDSSLIFIDELGAGTDPTEGAALAMAILERLHLMGARVMTTTHYTQLKAYALNTPRIENASCEFNIETLEPTYRLLIGVPGRSNAFAISRRLGMEEEIVDRAREFLSGDNTRFEDVVEQLEISRRELDRQREEAEQARQEAQHARDEARRKLAEIDAKYDEEIERGRSEAVKIADRARRESQTFLMELDRLKKELKKSGDVEGTASRAKAVSKKKMGALDEISDPIRRRELEEEYDPNFPIHTGDTVLIADIGSQAEVIAPPDKDGNVQVQSGLMKMRVHRSNLRPSKAPKKKKPAGTRSVRGVESRASRSVASTVDLRGMTKDEALLVLDRFIDSAVLSGIGDITIVHGKGTGVLRAAVQTYLKKNPRIKEYRLGVYGEGEDGVTIAKLK